MNTLPSSERRAVANLERQNIVCYLPYVSRSVRSGRILVNQKRPLFPSYVFIRLDQRALQWRSVDGTYGVRQIVKVAGIPAPVPVGCLELLQDMTDQDGCVSFASRMKSGDTVRFMSGPLHGFIGSLETLDASGRITVLLELLGRKTIVKAKASEVVPLSEHAGPRDTGEARMVRPS